MTEKANRQTAQATFRQFAWNLAGTLADRQGKSKPQARRPAGGGGKR